MKLSNLFNACRTVNLEFLGTATNKSPPLGKAWLYMGGRLDYVTGTNTVIDIRQGRPEGEAGFGVGLTLTRLLAGVESGIYPVPYTASTVTGVDATEVIKNCQISMLIIDDEHHMHFEGAATAVFKCLVLEFDST